jgi:hypothetical protein
MKQVNLVEYLEVIGEGEYKVDINNHIRLIDAIDEKARIDVYLSCLDDCDYIDIAVEEYGWDIERSREYFEQIEEWAENLEFEELSEDIKEEIIKDIAENEMELKIIESVRKNNYDKYLQIIRDYTYTTIYE